MSSATQVVLAQALAFTGLTRGRIGPDDDAEAPQFDRRGSGVLRIRLAGPDGAGVGVLELDDAASIEVDDGLRAFAALAGALLAEADALRQADERHQQLVRRHRSSQTASAVERRLGLLVGGPGGAQAIVDACAELTGKVIALYAEDEHVLATAGPDALAPSRVTLPALADLLAAAAEPAPTGPVELAAHPLAGLPRRHLLAPVSADDERFGWLVALEQPARLRPLDTLVVGRAAEHLARELAVQRRVANVAWNARSSLARQLIRGSNDVDDLRASGEYLGVDTTARRVLVYAVGSLIDASGPTSERRLAELLQRRLGVEVLATRGSEAVLFLVQVPDGVSSVEFVARVKSALRSRGGADAAIGELTAGLSSVSDAAGLARAYREAREVAHCIDRFAPRSATRVLAVDDLGPARLFVANSAVTAVRAYVDDVLGALLTGDPASADLITTLGSYFDLGRSVRGAGGQLGVHENTVRLRLARIRAATGLDVAADANDQLSAQTALLVLRLQGHPALPSFEAAAGDAHGRRTA